MQTEINTQKAAEYARTDPSVQCRRSFWLRAPSVVFAFARVRSTALSRLREGRPVCGGGALLSVQICKEEYSIVSMAGRGGFRCGCLRWALPTTSPSPRLGSTLPQAGEFIQRIFHQQYPGVCGRDRWASDGAWMFWRFEARTKKPALEGDDPKRAFVMFGGESEVNFVVESSCEITSTDSEDSVTSVSLF